MTPAPDRPLRSGDAAPNFSLPAVNREGIVSLADYRGKSPVMVGLFRGLHVHSTTGISPASPSLETSLLRTA
jgi:peroxiredoxin